MTKQQELDLLEEAVLQDLFGGTSADKMVINLGLFKIDLSPRVQRGIDALEAYLSPLFDEDGTLNGSTIKTAVDVNLPDGKIRPVELYRKFSPLVVKIKEILL